MTHLRKFIVLAGVLCILGFGGYLLLTAPVTWSALHAARDVADSGPADLQNGESLFYAGSCGTCHARDYCATCHGEELQNNSGVTFDLRRLREGDHSRFVASVIDGKGAMPSWKSVLDADQIETLWAYIRANAND